MPPQIPQEHKNMKPVVLVASVGFLILITVIAYMLITRPTATPINPIPVENEPATTTVVKVEKPPAKASIPSAFTQADTVAERKEVLLALAKKSITTKLTLEEKAYILKEFGGERTSLYGFTDSELKLIVDALNR